jgi:hypothetical protein
MHAYLRRPIMRKLRHGDEHLWSILKILMGSFTIRAKIRASWTDATFPGDTTRFASISDSEEMSGPEGAMMHIRWLTDLDGSATLQGPGQISVARMMLPYRPIRTVLTLRLAGLWKGFSR